VDPREKKITGRLGFTRQTGSKGREWLKAFVWATRLSCVRLQDPWLSVPASRRVWLFPEELFGITVKNLKQKNKGTPAGTHAWTRMGDGMWIKNQEKWRL